jgi:hypothetical protein
MRTRLSVALVAGSLAACACGSPLDSPAPLRSTVPGTPALGSWTPVPDQDAIRGVRFDDVAWTGMRFVAVGTPPAGSVAFFDSPDGLAWHRQADLGVAERPARLAAGRHGVVAVGTVDDRPASWFSPDGLAWSRSGDTFAVPDSGTDTVAVSDVVGTDGGWLAVGREDPSCNTNCGFSPVRALTWTSADGVRWTLVAGQTSLADGGMSAVTRTNDGFVAVGVSSRHAAIWSSSDGSAWSRVADDPMFHPQSDTDGMAWSAAVGVTAGPGMVVVLGSALGAGPGGAPSALAWRSNDGRTWAPAIVEDPTPDYGASVATTIDGFLATGRAWRDDWLQVVWASTDGRTWQAISSARAPDGFNPAALAASPKIEVAVGDSLPTGRAVRDIIPSAVWWRTVP